MNRYSILLPLLVLLASCAKSPEYVNIAYNITASDSSAYDRAAFKFTYVRAWTGSNVISSVYVESQNINLNLSSPQPHFLGTSGLTPTFIHGYDFYFENFMLIKGNDTLHLDWPDGSWPFSETSIDLNDGQDRTITFELDIDKSIILDSAGSNWISPKIITR